MKRRTLAIYALEALAVIFIAASLWGTFGHMPPPSTDGPIGVVIGDTIARGTSASRLQRIGSLDLPNREGTFAYELENVSGQVWFNQAINNANTTNLLERWDRDALGMTVHTTTYYSYIPDTTLPKTPLNVIVLVGRNDILEGLPVGQIEKNLVELARRTARSGVNATFCTVLPGSDLNASALLELNAWMKVELPKEGVRVWDAYAFFNDPARINLMRSEYADHDRVRPTADAVVQASAALWLDRPLPRQTATDGPIGVVIGDNFARGRNATRLQAPVDLDAQNEFGCIAYQLENVTGWVWYNQAISTANTTNLLERWNRDALGASVHATKYYDTIPDTTLPKKPACIVVLVGRNDLAENLSPTIIRRNLAEMAQRAERENVRVIFCTIPPAAGIDPRTIADVNDWMKDNLSRYHARVWDANAYFSGSGGVATIVYDESGRIRPSSVAIDQAALALWRDTIRGKV